MQFNCNIIKTLCHYFSVIILLSCILLKYAGPVVEDSNVTNRTRRSTPGELIHLTTPHIFAVYIVDDTHQNSPPVLLTKTLVTERNTVLSTQLLYSDPENDTVEFTLAVEPHSGTANMSSDGWLVYEPYPLFFGQDVMAIILNETDLPGRIQENWVEEVVRIEVRETPVAPALFLQLNEDLAKGGTPWRAFTGKYILYDLSNLGMNVLDRNDY